MVSEVFDFEFSFDDKRSLPDIIKNLETAIPLVQEFLELSGMVSQSYEKTVGTLRKSFKGVKDELVQVDKAIKNATSTKQVGEAVDRNAKLKKSYQDVKDEAIRLEKAVEKLRKTNKKTLEEQVRLQQARAKEKKIIREQIKDEQALNIVQNRQIKSQKDLREVTNAMVRLRDRLDTTTAQGRKKWEQYTKAIAQNTDKLKQNDAQIGRFTRNVGNYQSALDGVRNTFRKIAAVAGIAGGAFLIGSGVRKGIAIIKDYDEALADLQKTTGQSRAEVEAIAQEIRTFDTRTSVEDLLALATAAGRLGLRGDDVVGFTRSVDKAFVALGDSLEGSADEIGLTLGKIASTFGVEDEFGIAEGIERVGSSLNELGANSKATEGPIVDFTNRLAGVSAQADIAVTDVAALGALFDESGQSIEVAATTLNKLLPALGKDVERFAEIAGVTADEFKDIAENNPIEALKLVAQGAQSSEKGLVGLNQVLENFGIDSARAAGIVGVLADKTDRLTELQKISGEAFEENTSLTEEFEKKNNTLGASIDKLNKAFTEQVLQANEAGGVGEQLGEIIQFLTDNLEEIIRVVLIATASFVSFKTALFAQKAGREFIRTLRGIREAIIAMRVQTEAGTTRMQAFAKAIKSINFGVLVGAITAAVLVFRNFIKEAEGAEAAQNKIADAAINAEAQVRAEEVALKNLVEAAQADNISKEEKERLIKQINEISPEYLGNITAENIGTRETTKAVNEYIKATRTRIQIQILQNQVDQISNKIAEQRNRLAAQQRGEEGGLIEDIANSTQFTKAWGEETAVLNEEMEILIIEIQRLQSEQSGLEKSTERTIGAFAGLIKETEDSTKATEDEAKAAAKAADARRKQLEALEDLEVQNIRDEEQREKAAEFLRNKRAIDEANREIRDKEILDSTLEALEVQHQQKLLAITKKFDTQADARQIDLFKKFQEDKKKEEEKARKEAAAQAKFEDKILKMQIEARKKLLEQERKALEEEEKKKQQAVQETRDFTNTIITNGLSQAEEAANQRIEFEQNLLNRSEGFVEQQAALAAQGLDNTLAFEQEVRREREASLLAEQRRLEKIKRIETYFSLFSAFANDPNTGPAEAAGKALIQLKAGDAIAAVLEEGGIPIEQAERQNKGIFRGPSHKAGGIKVEVEGDEGFFNRGEMGNLGRDRFYALKKTFGDRKMTESFFRDQNAKMVPLLGGVPVSGDNKLAGKLDEIKKSLDALPDQMPTSNQWINKDGDLVTEKRARTMLKTTINKRRLFN